MSDDPGCDEVVSESTAHATRKSEFPAEVVSLEGLDS